MRIDGEWYESDDAIVRPVIHGEVLTAPGSWMGAEFLLDTGTDRTVFAAALLAALGLGPARTAERLGGLGGVTQSVTVQTQIRLTRDAGGKAIFRSRYAAVTSLEALDMSVLGRDITDLFAVVIDHPGDVVCLISQAHRYEIVPPVSK